jgi:hypothetical protein
VHRRVTAGHCSGQHLDAIELIHLLVRIRCGDGSVESQGGRGRASGQDCSDQGGSCQSCRDEESRREADGSQEGSRTRGCCEGGRGTSRSSQSSRGQGGGVHVDSVHADSDTHPDVGARLDGRRRRRILERFLTGADTARLRLYPVERCVTEAAGTRRRPRLRRRLVPLGRSGGVARGWWGRAPGQLIRRSVPERQREDVSWCCRPGQPFEACGCASAAPL